MINFLDVVPYEFPHAVDPQAGLKAFLVYSSFVLGIILAIIALVIVYKKMFKKTNKKSSKKK